MRISIQEAAKRLAEGDLVAFPTETVYGLGADAENPSAVAKIYQTKGRPQNHPVIVHLAPNADLSYWVSEVPVEAKKLIQHFWPGPLTLILPRAAHIPDAVSGGQSSVGVRCPSHPVAQALLTAFSALKPNGQGGVAAPSANKFGQVSPTSASHVVSEFPAEIQAGVLSVLEGDDSDIGIESTIVDFSRVKEGVGAVLLRPGHITRAQLAEVLGYEPASPDKAAPRVSGSLKAHYAPRTPLQMVCEEECKQLVSHIPAGEKWVLMAFKETVSQVTSQASTMETGSLETYAVSSDPVAYAREIYGLLRRLDEQGYQRICVQALPQDANWEALNDRLQRAAAAFV
ncbi:L-threonylcarbamoyladenylate synthase [Pelistega suis]|uniref:L-threonylcarbamoyladenylate synthase n=1 Tax=Pelistega suis TaxID=1631957 RepID=UPI00211C910A|nr:L-threonylcarbamoyladenylate synthase [Pelistega suis]MCQ9328198.1 L-threonylcarbamoyladenylate synthase [Pelistega suis]